LGGITVGGLVAAPGYFYALLSDSLFAVPRARRNVIRVSLLLAASVATAGVPWALFLAWPLAALPLLAIVACTHLIVRCESAWRNPRLALGLVASVLLLLAFVLGSFLLATAYELAGPSDCKELRFASLGELRRDPHLAEWLPAWLPSDCLNVSILLDLDTNSVSSRMSCPALQLDSIPGRETVDLSTFGVSACSDVAWWPRAVSTAGYRVSTGRGLLTYENGGTWGKRDYLALASDGDLLYWSP